MLERERQRDTAVEEVNTLNDAAEKAASAAEELRCIAQTRGDETRRISDELSRQDVELRKLQQREKVS